MPIPHLTKIQRVFPRPRLEDIERAVRAELDGANAAIAAGSRIAVAVGSRGIANIGLVTRTVVSWVKEKGADPFIVPAMGSHGGATAEGQRAVLTGYGITAESTGSPVVSSLDVVEFSRGGSEVRVFFDRAASEADGTILINRIKPHTDFHGELESGLIKMCVIGLGKHRQAMEIHRHGIRGLRELIPPAARQIIKEGNIILGVALVENAYDETRTVKALRPNEFFAREPRLLRQARESMPRLPVDELDVLLVNRMGKEISGSGLDTNIIGRMKIKGECEPARPTIAIIAVADLSDESHGNAIGMGLADIITRRLYDKIDFKATYENVITSTFLERGKVPVVAESDREALEIALRTCGPVDPLNARIIRIRDTLHLDEMHVSGSVLEEIVGRDDVAVSGSCPALDGHDYAPF